MIALRKTKSQTGYFLSAIFIVIRRDHLGPIGRSYLLIAATINKVPGGRKNPFSLHCICDDDDDDDDDEKENVTRPGAADGRGSNGGGYKRKKSEKSQTVASGGVTEGGRWW